MLDLKLVTYLRENPALFSKVLERLLFDQAQPETYGVFPKRKAIELDSDEEEGYTNTGLRKKKRRVDQQVPVEVPRDDNALDTLVPEILTQIIDIIVNLAKEDETTLIDLICLASTCRTLEVDVMARVVALNLQLNSVPLYCRALFDYFENPGLFSMFLERVRENAPATHAGWLFIFDRSECAPKLRLIVAYLKKERPEHYALAMQENGTDPIATALALYDMAYGQTDGATFSEEDIAALYENAYDKRWLHCMTQMVHLPKKSGVPPFVGENSYNNARLLATCIQRNALDNPDPTTSLKMLAKFLSSLGNEWEVGTDFPRLRNAWKRMCKTPDRDGFFDVYCYLFTRVERGLFSETTKLLTYWYEEQLGPNESIDEDQILSLINVAREGLAPVVRRRNNASRWAAMNAFAILAARKRLSRNMILSVFGRIFGPRFGEKERVQIPMWLLLHMSLKRGYFELVYALLEDPLEVFKRVIDPNSFKMEEVIGYVCSNDFVAKRDRSGEMQLRMIQHFCSYFPDLANSFFSGGDVGQDALSKVAIKLISDQFGHPVSPHVLHRFQLCTGTLDKRAFMDKVSFGTMLSIALDKYAKPKFCRTLIEHLEYRVNALPAASQDKVVRVFLNEALKNRDGDTQSNVGSWELTRASFFWRVAIQRGLMSGRMISLLMVAVKNPLIFLKKLLHAVSSANDVDKAPVLDAIREYAIYSSNHREMDVPNALMYVIRTPLYHKISQGIRDEEEESVLGMAMERLYDQMGTLPMGTDIVALESLFVATKNLDN